MRNLGLIGIAIGLIVVLACSNQEPAPPPAPAAAAVLVGLYPVTVENCGITFTYDEAPSRAIALNQHVTEVMLALGLQDQMIGTAYIDDFILPEYESAYNAIPILAKEYPSREVIFGAEPDFIYGGFGSAFDAVNAGSQEELQTLGINSYLTTAICEEGADSLEDVYTDITKIGTIFGVPDRADAIVNAMKADLEDILSQIGTGDEPVRAFLYDSGDDAPYTSLCCGMITPLIESAGGNNVFDDVEGRWQYVSWEEVIARDPEVIVLTDAVWSTADEKIELLSNDPVLAEIAAVKNGRYVKLQFSSMVPSIRNQTAVEELAKGFYPGTFE